MATAPATAARRSWTRTVIIGIPILVVLAIAASFTMLGRTKQPPSVDALVPRDPGILILAVLPFSNIGGDPSEQYFIDALAENVITSLSKLSGRRVIARSSAFAFAGVEANPREGAEQLGVRSVLLVSVRRWDDRLRVTAKLVDTDNGAHLWTEQFDGGIGDLFAFQDQVLEQAARALSVNLTAVERCQVPEDYAKLGDLDEAEWSAD